MAELIVSPDVEAWAVAYLKAQLALRSEPYAQDVYVATRVPEPRRSRMVIIRRDGGAGRGLVTENARLGIRVWGPEGEDGETVRLALMVQAMLNASPGNGPVRAVNQSSGSGPSYIAEESGQPLRYLVVELVVRRSSL